MRRHRRALSVAAVVLAALAAAATPALAKPPRLVHYSGFEEAAWSPDGSLFSIPTERAIEVRRAGGGGKTIGSGRLGYFGFPCECSLGWLPDSSRILFLSHSEELEGDASVGEVAPDGGGLQLQALHVPVGDVGWGPAGFPAVFVPNERTFTGHGKRVGPNPDLWLLDAFGAPPRKLLALRGEEVQPRFSPDGSRILFQLVESERRSSLRVVGADGSGLRTLVRSLLGTSEASWSADGSRIAVETFSRQDRRAHVYVVAANGGRLRKLGDETVQSTRPAWSPDGAWIAYSNVRGQIREIHPDGTGARTLLSLPGEEIRGLAFSPDGSRLAYSARRAPHTD
jgi:Tol biopolymer transport system component